MLAIYLYREGERTQRIVSAKPEISLGSAGDMTLADCEPRHCKLVMRPAGVFLVQEDGLVSVNGKAIDRATPLYDTDKVFVGPYSFMIEVLERAPDPNEDKLLAEIAAGDDTARLVYADWLEENGDIRRAELLRCQELLRELAERGDSERVIEQGRRLRQLATLVDQDWRMKVARPPVEGCRAELRFDFQCPKTWSELVETGTPNIRFCDLCREQVYYATTIFEARSHAWANRCVALDPSIERSGRDLEQTPPAPRFESGEFAQVAPGMLAPMPEDS